jgi:hypothetical protein
VHPFLIGFTVFPQAQTVLAGRIFFRLRMDAFLLREHPGRRDEEQPGEHSSIAISLGDREFIVDRCLAPELPGRAQEKIGFQQNCFVPGLWVFSQIQGMGARFYAARR